MSFCSNIGIGSFQSGTVLKDVNNSNFDAVPDNFRMWGNAGGLHSDGLADRRGNEKRLRLGLI